MKIFMLVKRVNNTELNRRGTNDSYIRIPNNVDSNIIFNTDEEFIDFTDKRDGEKFKVRHRVTSNEIRYDKLGDYYRKYDITAGDPILFERRSYMGNDEYYIDHIKLNSVCMLKSTKGFELLSGEINDLNQQNENIKITELGWFKKKENSRNETLFYDLLIDEESQIQNFSSDDMVEIKRINGELYVASVNKCRVYSIEFE